MKTIKHTLLIFLVSFFIISCGNDRAYTEESTPEMIQKKEEAAKKAQEEASTIDITVDKVTSLWQKNILWFFYQKVAR